MMDCEPEPRSRAVPHILVADDDIYNLNLLKLVLQRDYRVTTVQSGEEALDALASDRFELVILDVMMPGINGFDVLSAIRQLPFGTDLPVMLVSALAQPSDIVRGLQLGASDYITKPFNMEVMRARIQRHLMVKQALDERETAIAYLKDAEAMKDHFLRIATHDLKNPLNSIRLAQYYLRDLVGENRQALNALDAIEETVSWMNNLVEDFLDTSMLKNGKAELELEAVNVPSVIWQVIDQYGGSANRKGVTLMMGKMEGVAMADRNRLIQVIGNLVSNAVKYSPPERFITISSEVKGSRVHISVADEGPGIPPEERELLFKAFVKTSARPTGGESSSGLGLWIVKELVELLGGEVSVDSPPDGGSVFTVELPQYQPALDTFKQ
jgi:signal transduction histidine kinase